MFFAIARPRLEIAGDAAPQVLGGLGLAIVSTSRGVLSGTEAERNGVGGEVLCQVW